MAKIYTYAYSTCVLIFMISIIIFDFVLSVYCIFVVETETK